MFSVKVTCGFETKTREQAEYIRKFFDDAQSLMTCENSTFASSNIEEIVDCMNPECPKAGYCGGECVAKF